MSGIQQLLLGGSPAGYQIERSLRFNSADTAYLNRTFASVGNRTTWTYSIWLKRSSLGSIQRFFSDSSNNSYFRFDGSDLLEWNFHNGTTSYTITSSQVFRDPSAWYHIMVAVDTTQATAANRIKIYVNGSQITAFSSASYPAQNATSNFNNNTAHYISGYSATAEFFAGYLTEVNFIDGQALTPSSFGQTNASTGVWEPIAYTGTYGTNGFYLNFSDNSNTTAATLGKDSSGNGNNWTPNNFSVTAGVGNDSLVDTPTSYGTDTGAGGEVRGNYCTLNPLAPSSYVTISNGNLTATGNTATNSGMAVASIGTSTGKYVWEETITTVSGNFPGVGATTVILQDGNGQNPGASNTLGFYYRANGTIYKNSASLVGTYSTFSNGDVVRFELDADALTCAVYKNNTLIVTITGLTAGTFYPSNVNYNSSVTNSNFGQRPFANTPNTGFKALCTQNLPTPTIGATSTTQANKYFDATLYTGTSASQSVTNSGSMQPDLVWIKSRSAATDNKLTDAVRGTTKGLISNTTGAETTDTNGLTAFNSNGFTVGSDSVYNNGTGPATYVAWQWNAGGSNATNTSGTITSTVRANTTSGFSIVTYTGTGANATVGHGLGVAPSMVIVKQRSAAGQNWGVYHISTGNTGGCILNGTNANNTANSGWWNNTTPTSTVFSVGGSTGTDWFTTNQSTATYVAYCFAEVAGYSAFGSYTGNNSADGPFVYLGFRPKYVMIKDITSTGVWWIGDSARATYNVVAPSLFANSSQAESSAYNQCDFLSNGFKWRADNANSWPNNISGNTYIYAAFAETPFAYSLAR